MKKYKDLFIALLSFLLYFGFSIFFSYVLKLFKIDISSLSPIRLNALLILSDLVFMTIIFFIYRKDIINDAKNFVSNKGKWFIKHLLLFASSVLLMGVLNVILSKITNQDISENEELVRKMIKVLPVYMTFSTVIYAPFVEETLFRKAIRKIIKGDDKYTMVIYVLISAIVFGFMHVISLDASFYDLLMGIPYMVVGLSLGYIYYKTDNVFASMQFHLMHNLILVVLQLMLRG